MARFHTLKISEVRKETEDTVSIAFDVPQDAAGDFAFVAGQYLTLKKDIDGQDVRRSYSICSAPESDELRVAVKQVEGGLFSTYANQSLKAGDSLEVMSPAGRFSVTPDPKRSRNYALFASGSGITPVISIAKSVLQQEPDSRVILFYGNRKFDTIIFREELAGLKNVYMDRFQQVHVLSRENLGSDLNRGRIDAEKCDLWSKTVFDVSEFDDFFLCGPEEMIKGVSGWLEGKGVDAKSIHFELFTSPLGALKGSKPVAKKASVASGDMSQVRVILDGDIIEFELAYEGDNVLDAAHQVGGDLPFACKGGVCCTCRAKVIEGEVDMDVNYALEPEEVEAGFVLTCQAHPKTPKVVVTFDEV